MSFIVGLNRDRDSYQVARAVAEVGQLERLVTDYYVGKLPTDLPTLEHRSAPGISSDQVTMSWRAFLAQLPYEAGRRVRPIDFPSRFVESALGATIASVARRHPEADLLLYSGSARQAFEGPSTGRRVLFQYHPSPHFIERTMIGLDEMERDRPWLQEAEVLSDDLAAVHEAEIARTELAVCASSLTRAGLVADGIDPSLIHVVPYGCPDVVRAPLRTTTPTWQALFVGQGVQRKGLHLLLAAWRQADLPGAALTLVVNRFDPEIEAMAAALPSVTVRSRLPREELDRVMAEADTLILPSLVEGFGLVLGEALSRGARLLASDHTGLVDMGLPPELAQVVPAGQVQPLVEALEHLAETYDPDRPYRERAYDEAERLSWAGFRAGIREAVGLPGELA